ncbi:MAG: malate synthase A [Usitatibacter sp.]
MDTKDFPPGLQINAPLLPEYGRVLSKESLAFVAKLCREFEPRRQQLLAARAARQKEFDAGRMPDFLESTKSIREGAWKIAAQPNDLLDRRVEITGPTDRKMVINALNCGAATFMADLEDANCPTWDNMISGQANLLDAVTRTIAFEQNGKQYRLNEKHAVLIPRPRGWHLDEKHIVIDGKPASGALVDFGLNFFLTAKERIARGSGPYYYLPKMESHLEARLWNDIFTLAQKELGIAHGTVRATVLIETLPAAFEMDEMLWELKDHSAGLNIGRWDYIFSCIKKLRSHRDFCLADRAQVTMTSPFMRSYALLLVKTCHHRNAPAMGGMAAQIPIKHDPVANEAAMAKVRADKEREATDGCDGTWVAHPAMVAIAKEVFDKHMPTPNQYSKQRPDVNVTAKDLLDFRPEAPITEAGLRGNVQVGIQYIGAWLAGNGCVPIFNLMEDAATAEISRSQVWQWMRSPKGVLDDGRKVTKQLFREILVEELHKTPHIVGAEAYAAGRYADGAKLFEEISLADEFVEFLTLPAYEAIE